MAEISGTALTTAAVGAIFIYGGLTGKSPLAAAQAVIKGSNPKSVPQTTGIGGNSGTPGGGAGSPPPPGVGNPNSQSAQDNQTIAHELMGSYGWNTVQEWAALVNLWNKESGWSNTADTRVSGAGGDNASSTVFAYGIAQARPATKYPKAGQPPDLGGKADPKTQIVWGMNYIKGRYGSPSMAWAHELANNWY